MYHFLKNKISKESYLNFLIFLIPFSFIAGNLLININIILIISLGLLFYKKLLKNIKYYLLDKLILLYFILLLVAGISSDHYFYSEKIIWTPDPVTTFKAILFAKYILFYLVLRAFVEKNLINFKFFFISCLAASLFVSFDIFYQLINGEDIFGFKSTETRKLAGPFDDEYIAGSFIQRFSIFSFFLIPIFFRKFNQKHLRWITPLLFVIFFLGITFSGNRMPLILFLFSIVLIFLFQKNIRKYFTYFLILFPIIFLLIYNFNPQVKNNFNNLFTQVKEMKTIITSKKPSEETAHFLYIKQFKSFYDTWLINKYVGGGIKNFRYFCHHIPDEKKQSNFTCNMHPHNYYLEILTESGIIGFIIILSIFSIIIYLSLIKKYFMKSNLKNINIIIPFIFLFIVEIFPIKSTGSFFTTGNTTYLVFLIAVLIGFSRKEKIIEK